MRFILQVLEKLQTGSNYPYRKGPWPTRYRMIQEQEADKKQTGSVSSFFILQPFSLPLACLMAKSDREPASREEIWFAGSWHEHHRAENGRVGLELWDNPIDCCMTPCPPIFLLLSV